MARDDAGETGSGGDGEGPEGFDPGVFAEGAEGDPEAAGVPPEALAAAMGRMGSLGGGDDGGDDDPKPAGRGQGGRKADSRANIVSLTAELGPSAGAAFRSWAARHRALLKDADDVTAFSWYLHTVIWRDLAADRARPDGGRQYDDTALFIEDLDGLIDRQVEAKLRAETAAAVQTATATQRQAHMDRLKAAGCPQPFVDLLGVGGGASA